MTSRRLTRLTAGAALAAVMLLAGCGDDPDESMDSDDPGEASLPEPEFEGDDTVRLPLGMVSPEGHDLAAPIAEDGRVRISPDADSAQRNEIARTEVFGCTDTVSVIRSVPVVTDDAAFSAVEFLVQDAFSEHGDPEFRNPLAISEELRVEEVTVEDDVVAVELAGDLVVRDGCEAWQVYTQVDATARAASGAASSELTLDGVPLAQALGIDADQTPVTIREITEILR